MTTDPAQRAIGLSVRGSTLSDQCRYSSALHALDEALGLAQDERRRSYVLSMIGRLHLLRGELDAATEALDEAMARATGAGWTAFFPWPESLRAEIDLRRGDVAAAQTRLEHAFALGCQIGDPCWEGISARGLGLVRAAQGDVDGAVESLLDARRSARLATISVSQQLPPTGTWGWPSSPPWPSVAAWPNSPFGPLHTDGDSAILPGAKPPVRSVPPWTIPP